MLVLKRFRDMMLMYKIFNYLSSIPNIFYYREVILASCFPVDLNFCNIIIKETLHSENFSYVF